MLESRNGCASNRCPVRPRRHPAEGAVTADLLQKRLGLNVGVATTEWGTVIKRIYSKNPVAQGGWNVFVTAFAAHDMLNPATTRNLRAPGAKGVLPGWADDEKLEALRAAWLAATDDATRREIAAQIQQRALRSCRSSRWGSTTRAPRFAPT